MIGEFEWIMTARVLPAKQREFKILDCDNLLHFYIVLAVLPTFMVAVRIAKQIN